MFIIHRLHYNQFPSNIKNFFIKKIRYSQKKKKERRKEREIERVNTSYINKSFGQGI